MFKSVTWYRQGDMTLFLVTPAMVKKFGVKLEMRTGLFEKGLPVLARGETTGHAHVLELENEPWKETPCFEFEVEDPQGLCEELGLKFDEIMREARGLVRGPEGNVTKPKFVKLDQSTKLVHRNLDTGELTQEHATQNLPKGTYLAVQQVEYTQQGLRNLAD